MRSPFGWVKPQTTKKTDKWDDEVLKPSLPRAPKLRKKTKLEHKPGLRVGIELEAYDPKVDK